MVIWRRWLRGTRKEYTWYCYAEYGDGDFVGGAVGFFGSVTTYEGVLFHNVFYAGWDINGVLLCRI